MCGGFSLQAQSAGDIDTLSQWRVDQSTGDPQYMYHDFFTYYIYGTITIDSIIYYKVYRNGYYMINSGSPNFYNGYWAPLREESNRWYTIDDNEEDVLLYDFTLTIGDTVNSYANFYGGPGIITVVSIDTIVLDGEPKKRFNLSENFGAEYIIEDVGASTGIWEPLIWFEDYSILNCYAKDFIPVWINPESGTCDVSTVIKEPRINIDLHAFPNPFLITTTIEFELKERSKIQISIYNSIGTKVCQINDVYEHGYHKITWSPIHLPAGLYYVVLRSEDGVSVVKMVKH